MKKLANSIILLLVAVILFAFFVPLSILYSLFLAPWQLSYLTAIVLRIAVAIDQLANVVCAGLFNHMLVRGCKPFGLEDDTISEVLATHQDCLTPIGKAIVWILEKVDRGHLIKALVENEPYKGKKNS